MKLDVTRLPLGEALVGFVLAAVVVTFVLAFAFAPGSGLEGEETVGEPSPTPAADQTPGGGTTVQIAMIPTIQFDAADISVPAGGQVTLTADNQDDAIPHNWALYTDESASEQLAATEVCSDCTETITFDPPPPGDYFFRCDVHPLQMVGTFTVE